MLFQRSHSSRTRCSSSRPSATRRSYQRLALVQQLVLRDAAREDDRVHGELLDAEVRVEEVDGEDEAGGEQGFIRMNDQGDVDDPAGQEPGEERRGTT